MLICQNIAFLFYLAFFILIGGFYMTKVHEINLNTKLWNFFTEHDFIILDLTDKQINEQDYVLFKQVSLDEGKETDTGLFRMTQIRSITTNDGFKDGYVMLNVTKL
jgi:hypothetical protein